MRLKISKKEIFLVMVVCLLYFAVRLPNLTVQPIFADEAIYIRWAQVMRAEPTLRFLPLSDGKTPLFMWVMIPLLRVIEDPLLAGRLLSVLSGFMTLAGVLFIGWRFIEKRVGILAAFLVAVTPYTVFFDRMALVDSMLSAFTIWTIALAMLLVKFPRTDLAMVLGYLLGGGLLTKTPALFNVLSVPFSLILFERWRGQDRQPRLVRIFSLWMIAIFIALLIFNILRLGSGFTNLNSRNQDYVHPPTRILDYFLDPFKPHAMNFLDVNLYLLGIPLLSIFAISMFLMVIRRNSYVLVLFLWSLFPLLAQLSLLKTFTARYVLFSIPPLLILSAWGIFELMKTRAFQTFGMKFFLGILIFSWPAFFIYKLHIDPLNLPLAKNEKRGYFEDWTAGYGFLEIASYLQDLSKKGIVVVGTEGSFGTLSDGLQIYVDKNRDIIVVGGKGTISAQLRKAADDHQTFFVSNRHKELSIGRDTQLIMTFLKPATTGIPQHAIKLYRVFPDNESSSSSNTK